MTLLLIIPKLRNEKTTSTTSTSDRMNMAMRFTLEEMTMINTFQVLNLQISLLDLLELKPSAGNVTSPSLLRLACTNTLGKDVPARRISPTSNLLLRISWQIWESRNRTHLPLESQSQWWNQLLLRLTKELDLDLEVRTTLWSKSDLLRPA